MSDQLVDCACGGKASWDYLVPDSDPVYVRCNGECGARIEGPDIGEAFRRWALCMAPSEPPRSESAAESSTFAALRLYIKHNVNGQPCNCAGCSDIRQAIVEWRGRAALRSAPASPEPTMEAVAVLVARLTHDGDEDGPCAPECQMCYRPLAENNPTCPLCHLRVVVFGSAVPAVREGAHDGNEGGSTP